MKWNAHKEIDSFKKDGDSPDTYDIIIKNIPAEYIERFQIETYLLVMNLQAEMKEKQRSISMS